MLSSRFYITYAHHVLPKATSGSELLFDFNSAFDKIIVHRTSVVTFKRYVSESSVDGFPGLIAASFNTNSLPIGAAANILGPFFKFGLKFSDPKVF